MGILDYLPEDEYEAWREWHADRKKKAQAQAGATPWQRAVQRQPEPIQPEPPEEPNGLEQFRQNLNNTLRQNVPGVAGGQEILPDVGTAFDWLANKGKESAYRLGDTLNPLSERRNLNPADYQQAVEAEAQKPYTNFLPEGPARGMAGLGGQILHDTALNVVDPTNYWRKAVGGLPEAPTVMPQEQFAQDWQRWQHEPVNPMVEVGGGLVNPANFIGPSEVVGGPLFPLLKGAGVPLRDILKIGAQEAAPEIGRVGKALLAGERGGGTPLESLGNIAKGKMSAKTGKLREVAPETPVAPETAPSTTMPTKAAEMPPETATGAIEGAAGKEPWQMSQAEWEQALDKTPPMQTVPDTYTVDWGKQRHQGKRTGGGMVVGGMGDISIQGKKTYTRQLPTDFQEQGVGGKTIGENFETLSDFARQRYLQARGLGMSHKQAMAEGLRIMPDFQGRGIDGHKQAIEQALSEGKPVPAAVLSEYPDLAAKAPTTPAIAPELAPQPSTVAPKTEAPLPQPPQPVAARKPPDQMSAAELQSAGYIPVYRGVGPRGMAEIRPSSEGQLGAGAYFYDNPMDARAYAGRGGGIVTGFVHPSDVQINGKIIVLQDPSKLIRRGTIPTDLTLERSQIEAAAPKALETPTSRPSNAAPTQPVPPPTGAIQPAGGTQLPLMGGEQQPPIGPPTPPTGAAAAVTPPPTGTAAAGTPTVPPTTPTAPTGPAAGAPVRPNSWLSTMKPTPDLLAAAYDSDWIRTLADKIDNPITRKVGQAMGLPKRDVFTEGTVIRESILADGKSSVAGAMSHLLAQGGSKKVFSVDKNGMASIGGRRVPLNDVLEYPDRHTLTPEQRQYAETIHKLYDDQRDILVAEGIDVNELQFAPGGHYVGRRVMGRLDPATGEIELAEIRGAGGKRVGAKAGFEKSRSFDTAEEGMTEGFRYLSPEEALQANLQQTYRKIADQRMSQHVLATVPYRTGQAPEALKVTKAMAQEKLAAVGKLKATILRGYRGERVPEATVASIGRHFPTEAGILVRAGISRMEDPLQRALLQQAEAAIPALKLQAQANYYRARAALAEASQQARAPHYGESMVMAPAFMGKFFSEADAKQLNKVLDLEQKTPLRGTAEAISWVNALPRLLLTTMDIGPALIQGQLTLFSHPVVWSKAVGQSAKAFATAKGYESFKLAHAETIKKFAPEGATFTPSEFTESIHTGGMAAKIPVLRQVMKPFARSYEALLNGLRIYGLEATEHLATTAADRVGLAKFWNEMSGVTDTARMGILPTQRATETAVFFAPRYYRATMALMTDVSKGGLRGKMARDSIGKATIAGALGYVATALIAGQEPKLDPRDPKFMTINVAGQNIGLGGFYLMLNRAFLKMALEPEKAHEIAAGFVRDRTSPLVSTAVRAYQFPYLYNTPLKLTQQVVLRNLMPIWAQGMLIEGQTGPEAAVSTATELAGGRAFPDKKPQGTGRYKYPGPPTNMGPPKNVGTPQYKYPGR